MMAVTRVGSAVASNSGTAATTLVVNKPTGTLQNHTMLAFVAYSNSIATLTPPTGWTEIGTSADALDARNRVYFKVAGSAEATTYTWTFSAVDNPVVAIATYRGVDSVGTAHGTAQSTTVTTQNVTGPSVVTTVTCHIVHLRCVRDDLNSAETITSNAGIGTAFQAEMHIAAPVNVVIGGFDTTGTDAAAATVAGTQLNYSQTTPLGSISRTIALKSGNTMPLSHNTSQSIQRGAFI